MIRALIIYIFVIFIGQAHSAQAVAGSYLTADLSADDVILNYDFSGQYITVSGIVTGAKDIIVVVDGPARAYRVWRKEKRNMIWLNGQSLTVPPEHSYFYVAASADIDSVASPTLLRDLGINEKYIGRPVHEQYPEYRFNRFREEFILNRQELGLYPKHVGNIERIGENIFRARFFLPACAYNGKYEVRIFALSKSKLIRTTTLYFEVKKHGLYALVDKASREMPLKYAAVAIAIALFCGLCAGFVFRNDR